MNWEELSPSERAMAEQAILNLQSLNQARREPPHGNVDDLVALNQATAFRDPPGCLIVHSDRGSQFASHAFRKRPVECDFLQSMSRTGNCYDNAPMEIFFKSFKVEEVYHDKYETHGHALRGANDYIERFYNFQRLHSALDDLSPLEFEKRLLQTEPVSAALKRNVAEKSAFVGEFRENK